VRIVLQVKQYWQLIWLLYLFPVIYRAASPETAATLQGLMMQADQDGVR
jgi:hypothetical protein